MRVPQPAGSERARSVRLREFMRSLLGRYLGLWLELKLRSPSLPSSSV